MYVFKNQRQARREGPKLIPNHSRHSRHSRALVFPSGGEQLFADRVSRSHSDKKSLYLELRIQGCYGILRHLRWVRAHWARALVDLAH